MLKTLSRHFGTPVMPIDRYCTQLETWGRCIAERASRLEKELFPNLHDWDNEKRERPPEAKAQREEYDCAKARHALHGQVPTIFTLLPKAAAGEVAKLTLQPDKKSERDYAIDALLDFEEAAHRVERTFLSIRKSNLLARLLYSGEKLRTVMCPEHKGKWSGIEWSDNVCPHKCQLTGWVQESTDQGKPLPGVQAVKMVPTGGAPGHVTMIRDVDGEVLGKATIQEIPKPKCGDIDDAHCESMCLLDAGHTTPHRDDLGNEWPRKN